MRMIEALPDDVSLDDVMAELYFRSMVDEGLVRLDGGEGISHEEARTRLGKWLDG